MIQEKKKTGFGREVCVGLKSVPPDLEKPKLDHVMFVIVVKDGLIGAEIQQKSMVVLVKLLKKLSLNQTLKPSRLK